MASNQAADPAGKHELPASDEPSGKFRLGDNARGALIMAAGTLLLVGLAFGGMVLLTSPGSWVNEAATSAMSGEQVGLLVPVSFADAN